MIETLTPRQREVLALVAEGMSNKEIARHLGIAKNTVSHHHMRDLYAKLLLPGGSRVRLAALWRDYQQGGGE